MKIIAASKMDKWKQLLQLESLLFVKYCFSVIKKRKKTAQNLFYKPKFQIVWWIYKKIFKKNQKKNSMVQK